MSDSEELRDYFRARENIKNDFYIPELLVLSGVTIYGDISKDSVVWPWYGNA